MKVKPKWGIKSFVLADWTNGYVGNILIYTGKGVDPTVGTPTPIDMGLCSRVVLEMEGLEFSGHQVYSV